MKRAAKSTATSEQIPKRHKAEKTASAPAHAAPAPAVSPAPVPAKPTTTTPTTPTTPTPKKAKKFKKAKGNKDAATQGPAVAPVQPAPVPNSSAPPSKPSAPKGEAQKSSKRVVQRMPPRPKNTSTTDLSELTAGPLALRAVCDVSSLATVLLQPHIQGLERVKVAHKMSFAVGHLVPEQTPTASQFLLHGVSVKVEPKTGASGGQLVVCAYFQKLIRNYIMEELGPTLNLESVGCTPTALFFGFKTKADYDRAHNEQKIEVMGIRLKAIPLKPKDGGQIVVAPKRRH
jgi:hypothetical protein